MEIDRNQYPATFMDRVRSIAYRTDRKTGKLILKYGQRLLQSSRIKDDDKRTEFLTNKLQPAFEALDSVPETRNLIRALYINESMKGREES